MVSSKTYVLCRYRKYTRQMHMPTTTHCMSVLVSCLYCQVTDIYENLPAKRKQSVDNLM